MHETWHNKPNHHSCSHLLQIEEGLGKILSRKDQQVPTIQDEIEEAVLRARVTNDIVHRDVKRTGQADWLAVLGTRSWRWK